MAARDEREGRQASGRAQGFNLSVQQTGECRFHANADAVEASQLIKRRDEAIAGIHCRARDAAKGTADGDPHGRRVVVLSEPVDAEHLGRSKGTTEPNAPGDEHGVSRAQSHTPQCLAGRDQSEPNHRDGQRRTDARVATKNTDPAASQAARTPTAMRDCTASSSPRGKTTDKRSPIGSAPTAARSESTEIAAIRPAVAGSVYKPAAISSATVSTFIASQRALSRGTNSASASCIDPIADGGLGSRAAHRDNNRFS